MSEKISSEKSTLLKVNNLSIAFGGLKAVDSLSFDIKEKEIFGLIGPTVQVRLRFLTASHSSIRLMKEKCSFRIRTIM